jgi:hypothetical protein
MGQDLIQSKIKNKRQYNTSQKIKARINNITCTKTDTRQDIPFLSC